MRRMYCELEWLNVRRAVEYGDEGIWGPGECGRKGSCVDRKRRLEGDAVGIANYVKERITFGGATDTCKNVIHCALTQSMEVLGDVPMAENARNNELEGVKGERNVCWKK